jgi:hypothetical protein
MFCPACQKPHKAAKNITMKKPINLRLNLRPKLLLRGIDRERARFFVCILRRDFGPRNAKMRPVGCAKSKSFGLVHLPMEPESRISGLKKGESRRNWMIWLDFIDLSWHVTDCKGK